MARLAGPRILPSPPSKQQGYRYTAQCLAFYVGIENRSSGSYGKPSRLDRAAQGLQRKLKKSFLVVQTGIKFHVEITQSFVKMPASSLTNTAGFSKDFLLLPPFSASYKPKIVHILTSLL